ncbi:MAG: hypothetical protein JRH18_23360 [Deltaproteobacteria bacterium]|nr:hypothetical protein [Deltaproteobacteria bacterium]MBW2154584.1 hypothetical protein [Deltaproteobacteria bacterium]
MKKLFVVALALFFVAGLVATGYAEDRLSLSGAYRVRAWAKENYSDFSDNDDADDQAYWDQRFRVAGKFQIAEGVSSHFRFDIGEAKWGLNTTTKRGWNRPTHDNEMFHIDRAYGRWEQDLWILNAGLAYTSFGNQIAVDQNQFGFILRLKLPVQIDGVYSKIDESGDTRDDGEWDDIDFYGGQATYKADNWSVGLFAAAINDQTDTDDSPWVIGVNGSWSYGMFALKGELDQFGGDIGKNDVIGTQIYVDLKANVLPNASVGVEGFWANSTDSADETQVTGLTDSDSFVPSDRLSGFHGAIIPLSGIASVTGGSSKRIQEFDPSGENAGSVGFQLYGNYRFLEKWLVQAGYMYLKPQDDDITELDDVNVLNAALIWDCLPNTTARVGYNYTGPNFDGIDSDRAQAVVGMLQLSW